MFTARLHEIHEYTLIYYTFQENYCMFENKVVVEWLKKKTFYVQKHVCQWMNSVMMHNAAAFSEWTVLYE